MTIEEIKQLVNQRIIENYTGDITAEDVNRIMNETLDHLGASEGKVSELARQLADFAIDVTTGILTYGGKHFQLITIQEEEPIYYGAECGRAICGTAICGQI